VNRALLATSGLALAGCAQLLGLDKTTFDAGTTDAPSVCDGAPACVSSTGRSACGQLFGTGDTANAPLRVANFTGELCQPGITEGPCGLAVAAYPKATYFDGTLTGKVDGQIDDCGRFVVPDIDSSVADIAIEFTGIGFQTTATLVLGRELAVGEDRDIEAFGVTTDTTAAWASQLAATMPPETPETTSGYLITYTTSDLPLGGEAVAIDGLSAFDNPFGTVPWAAYFAAGSTFGVLDPTLMVTSDTGTAFAVLPAGTISVEGFRQGKRCKIADLVQLANTLIHVIELDC